MNGDTISALLMFAIAVAMLVHCLRKWRKEQRRCDALIAAALDEREDGAA